MTRVRFELNFTTDELKHLSLPIEIRKPNMVLVKRAHASESVDVPPGTYYVNLKMPAGQEAWSEVKVVEGHDHTVQLGPDAEDRPPSGSSEVQHYFTSRDFVRPQQASLSTALLVGMMGATIGAVLVGVGGQQTLFDPTVFKAILGVTMGAAVGGGLAFYWNKVGQHSNPGAPVMGLKLASGSFWKESTAARLRKFSGNVLSVNYSPDDAWTPFSSEATGNVTKIVIEGDNACQVLQLLQPGAPAVNVVLPTWAENSCQVFLTKLTDGKYSMEVYLKNTSADLLLRYWEQGMWQLAAGVANSTAISAEELLNQKRRHPIAAAVGAYALLRLGELERLHDWTENLKNWFDWLPDGLAIRGEHLARLGKHEEALRVFCELPMRGLPCFSDGLSYTVDRLRLYLSFGEEHFKAEDLKQAASVLALLDPFVAFANFRKPLLTYTGLDPAKPDAELVGKDLASVGGLDLSKSASWSKVKKTK
jgi:hypothetical protein